MTDLRTAAQQALEAMEKATRFMSDKDYRTLNETIEVLRAALAEPQITHSTDCYKWHHRCAIAQVERLKLLCQPVQKSALTDEQIVYAMYDAGCERIEDFYGVGPVQRAAVMSFARAIEQALETNKRK